MDAGGEEWVSNRLIDWYLENKRDLPWRNTNDPYKIWLSEIILQQTRVDQGLEYYLRFVARFPDIPSLASAEEDEVLKYWQGLGYYTRARNLHATAKIILEKFSGIFPDTYEEVLGLKGVGEYTAAAIVSFAWNKPYPSVDGNVFRFLSRLFAIEEPIDTGKGKKLFTSVAGSLIDKNRAGLFNQAIMEFGALQCVPVNPDCNRCPFRDSCLALASGKTGRLPVKQGKTKTEDRYLYYFHIHDHQYTWLHKRQESGVWRNLYEFPMIESETPLTFPELLAHPRFSEIFREAVTARFQLEIENKKHILSHRRLFATFYSVLPGKDTIFDLPVSHIRIPEPEAGSYPIHRLMELYWEQYSDRQKRKA